MKNYEINESTLAVIGNNNGITKILERGNEYKIENTSYKVMDYSCQYFGSSYQGRVKGSKNILNANYKLPIIVEDSNNLIFLPTTSPTDATCTWLSLKEIEKVENYNNNAIVYFKNGDTLTLNVSKYSLDNQIMRACRLEYLLRIRKNQKK